MQHFGQNYTSINQFATEAPNADAFYQYERDRSDFPAYHFRMSAHDMALYGQLYLNEGRWGDQQIIPAAWIEKSTQVHSVSNPRFGLGYGLLWGVVVPDAPVERNSFYHSGSGVHFLGVYPGKDMVMVHRVDTEAGSPFSENDLYALIGMVHRAIR